MDDTNLLPEGDAAGGNGSAGADHGSVPTPPTSNVNGRRNGRWRPPGPAWLPLSDEATSLFLSKVADTMVMGLITLATFSSTYLLAWGKPGTNCIPMLNNTTSNNTGSSDEGLKNPALSGQQILFGLLPFVILPIALSLSGLAKIAETDKRALSFVSAICFCEFTLAIALGGVMSYCMMGAQIYWVLGVTAALIFMMGVTWSLTFRYPKCVNFHRS